MTRWARAIVAIGLAWLAGVAAATVLEPSRAAMLTAPDATPPARTGPGRRCSCPTSGGNRALTCGRAITWYRIDFDYSPAGSRRALGAVSAVSRPTAARSGSTARWLAACRESSDTVHVRWARPHLVTLPASLLHPGSNEVMVRAALPPDGAVVGFPRPGIGPQAELQPVYERRFFWVNITPYITAAMCLLVAGLRPLHLVAAPQSKCCTACSAWRPGCGAFAH